MKELKNEAEVVVDVWSSRGKFIGDTPADTYSIFQNLYWTASTAVQVNTTNSKINDMANQAGDSKPFRPTSIGELQQTAGCLTWLDQTKQHPGVPFLSVDDSNGEHIMYTGSKVQSNSPSVPQVTATDSEVCVTYENYGHKDHYRLRIR